ncbi:MAG TPA: zinc-binding alcohol dehydrogenase, partial [Capsulimonadaceae bacterium]|nr:zinc-binding alcohol dehydrogenase [Capsulimonadaceae bacterium]
ERVSLETFDSAPLGPEDIRLITRYSLMSTGTENIVFNRLFDQGTHWDNWVRYPFYPGYAAVGRVAEVGRNAPYIVPGTLIAVRGGHASEHVIHHSSAVAVPEGISEQEAVWFALASIAFSGARASQCQLGDHVLVIGAGPIGQMSVRWAVANGAAKVAVVDPVPARLEMAERGGATAVISKTVLECKEDVLAAFDGQLPRIVIDSTGYADVFSWALELAAKFGRVVVLGDTGRPAGQHLTHDVIMRGLTIVGAHDSHQNEQWNNVTTARFFFDLVTRGRFDISGLNTHVFKAEDAYEAYSVANKRRGETMGIVFDWT